MCNIKYVQFVTYGVEMLYVCVRIIVVDNSIVTTMKNWRLELYWFS